MSMAEKEDETLVKHSPEDSSLMPSTSVDHRERKPIIVAVSSRALFNLEDANAVWEDPEKTRQDYIDHVKAQAEDQDYIPAKGQGFDFVKALQTTNTELKKLNTDKQELFEVLMISHNCGASCSLVKKALKHYDLSSIVKHVVLTDGTPPVEYLTAFGVNLFLTLNQNDVAAAMEKGIDAQLI